MKTYRNNRRSLMDYALAETEDHMSSAFALTGPGATLENRFDRTDSKREASRRRLAARHRKESLNR